MSPVCSAKRDQKFESDGEPSDDWCVPSIFRQLSRLSVTLQILVSDCINFCAACLRSRTALATRISSCLNWSYFKSARKKPPQQHLLIDPRLPSSPASSTGAALGVGHQNCLLRKFYAASDQQ